MKFKQILQKWVINNIGYKILALVFAFILWLVVVNLTDPTINTTISNIEVQIVNEDAVLDGDHVYTIESGKAVSVTVSGKRSVVSNLKPSDFIATADFSELSLTNAVPITVELARYNSGVTIKQRNNTMILKVEEIKAKYFNIAVELTGSAPDNMVIDSMTVSPTQLRIRAPESILNSIAAVMVHVPYSDIENSSAVRVIPEIYDASGTQFNPSEYITFDYEDVVVTAMHSYTRLVPVVANASGTPASGYRLDGIGLDLETVTIKGPFELINDIQRIFLPAELLDISGATEDVEVVVNLDDYLPDNVFVYNGSNIVTLTAVISEIPPETTQEETTSEDEGN